MQPRLSGVAGGTTFALTGHAKPLAPRRDAELDVDVDGLPLREYVGYLPATLRARLADGKLTTRLKVAFTQPPGETPQITVSGTAVVAGLAITRTDAAPLAAAREVRLALEKLDPQARTVRIATLVVDQPSFVVRRLADGRLELAGPWVEAAAPSAPAAAAGPPWRVELVEASVKDGRARVEDASVQPRYEAEVTALQATARTLATTAERSGRVTASMRIDNEASATLEAEVALAPFAMGGRFTVTNARLARLYPYAAQALDLAVQRGSADYASAFDVAASGEVRLTGGTASVRDLALALPRRARAARPPAGCCHRRPRRGRARAPHRHRRAGRHAAAGGARAQRRRAVERRAPDAHHRGDRQGRRVPCRCDVAARRGACRRGAGRRAHHRCDDDASHRRAVRRDRAQGHRRRQRARPRAGSTCRRASSAGASRSRAHSPRIPSRPPSTCRPTGCRCSWPSRGSNAR